MKRREQLINYSKEMFQDFIFTLENDLKAVENTTDIDEALEQVAMFNMYTTNIHDDNELDRDTYYEIRRFRDAMREMLNAIAFATAFENRK